MLKVQNLSTLKKCKFSVFMKLAYSMYGKMGNHYKCVTQPHAKKNGTEQKINKKYTAYLHGM